MKVRHSEERHSGTSAWVLPGWGTGIRKRSPTRRLGKISIGVRGQQQRMDGLPREGEERFRKVGAVTLGL